MSWSGCGVGVRIGCWGLPLSPCVLTNIAHHTTNTTTRHSFYDDVLAFHAAAADPAEQRRRLQQLHAAYLGPAAPSPLNIPDTMRRRFLAAYDALPPEAGAGAGEEEKAMAEVVKALGEVKKEVTALLERDNYARFKV